MHWKVSHFHITHRHSRKRVEGRSEAEDTRQDNVANARYSRKWKNSKKVMQTMERHREVAAKADGVGDKSEIQLQFSLFHSICDASISSNIVWWNENEKFSSHIISHSGVWGFGIRCDRSRDKAKRLGKLCVVENREK